MKKTSERLVPEHYKSIPEKVLYLKHFFAYDYASKNYQKGQILDIGCGSGYGTNFLAKKAEKIIGVDVDQKTINHCKKRYKRRNLVFKKYNGKKLPFKDNTFLLITCFQVIEHIKKDKIFLIEIKRVLENKGILLLTTPYRGYRLKRGQKPWNKFHVREYYISQFRDLLKEIFLHTKIKGITGNDLTREIEYQRVGYHKKSKIGYNRKFSVNDFVILNKNLKMSLDLLGICKKKTNKAL